MTKSFEDCKRTLVELEPFFFFTLSGSTTAFVPPWVLKRKKVFHDFLVIFSLSS
jgi:hypothetical protein